MEDTFEQRLRHVLEMRGMTLKELSDKSGVPYRSLQNYASGEQKPGSEALLKIKLALGVSIDWLLSGNDTEHPFNNDFRGQKEFGPDDYFKFVNRFKHGAWIINHVPRPLWEKLSASADWAQFLDENGLAHLGFDDDNTSLSSRLRKLNLTPAKLAEMREAAERFLKALEGVDLPPER